MNKLVITSIFLLFQVMLFSQITIDQNDMPQPGDTIRLSSAVDLGSLNYEETGNDYIWDFSDLTFLSQRVDTFVSVSQTPWIYQLVFILSANLASPGQSFDQLPGFEVTDNFNYYKNSSSEYKAVGFGITMNGIPIPNKFDDPDVIYQLPISIGDIDSSLSNYALDIPGLGYYGGWKKRVNYADGWGELTTPYGTFETVRIKSEIIQYDSLYIDSLGFGMPILRNFTEYKWLGDNFGLPLCTVMDDGIITTIDYIDSVRSFITTSIENDVFDPIITVRPNPFKHSITVNYSGKENSKVILKIYKLNGNQVYVKSIDRLTSSNENIFYINNLKLPDGIYLLDIQVGDKNYIHKIIKTN